LLGLGVAAVVVTELYHSSRAVREYGPNAAVEMFGIAFTVIIVERVIAWRRKHDCEAFGTPLSRRSEAQRSTCSTSSR
jgi:hypothetical protein